MKFLSAYGLSCAGTAQETGHGAASKATPPEGATGLPEVGSGLNLGHGTDPHENTTVMVSPLELVYEYAPFSTSGEMAERSNQSTPALPGPKNWTSPYSVM